MEAVTGAEMTFERRTGIAFLGGRLMKRVDVKIIVSMLLTMILLLTGSGAHSFPTVTEDRAGAISAEAAAIKKYDKMNVLIMGGIKADTHQQVDYLINKFQKNHIAQKLYLHTCKFDVKKDPITRKDADEVFQKAFSDSTNTTINVFYYMGHGAVEYETDSKVKALITTKCLDSPQNGIELGEEDGFAVSYTYFDLVNKLSGYKGKFIIIMDCCGSGSLITYGLREKLENEKKSNSKSDKFIALLTSTPGNYVEKANKSGIILTSGTPYSTTANEELRNYGKNMDTDQDGFITTTEFHNYLSTNKKVVDATHGPQIHCSNVLGQTFPLFQFSTVEIRKDAGQDTIKLKVGEEKTISTQLTPVDAGQEINWSKMNSKVDLKPSGREVTIKGTAPGKVSISAYIIDKNRSMCIGTESFCTVEVENRLAIIGRVLDSDTGDSIAGAAVTYRDKNDASVTASVVTDAEGKYRFEDVAGGDLLFFLSQNGYEDCEVEIRFDAQEDLEMAPVYLHSDVDVSDIAIDSKKEFRGHTYAVVYNANDYSWEEASAACRALGGHLVTITTQEEQEFVADMYSSSSYAEYTGNYWTWIGASKENRESAWKWVTGEEYSYSQEASQDLPDADPNGKFYLEMWDFFKYSTGYDGPYDNWYPCDGREHENGYSRHGFIIEWEE